MTPNPNLMPSVLIPETAWSHEENLLAMVIIVHVGITKIMATELVRNDNHREGFSRIRYQILGDKINKTTICSWVHDDTHYLILSKTIW